MKNLLQIFLRYGGFFLFLVLEFVCFFLIVQYNQKQQAVYISSTNAATGIINESLDDLTKHFALSEFVDSVARQNAEFQEILFNSGFTEPTKLDSIKNGRQQYQVIHAEVIKNTIKNNHNYMIIDKGSKDGIVEHSAVIDGRGIVGIVRGVSDHYADVMSLLHRQTRISATTKGNNQHGGSLVWESNNPFTMDLENIPKYIKVEIGDTVVTTGSSLMFPDDLMIGTVSEQSVPSGSSSHKIKVLLNNDISDVKYVYVVKNIDRAEILELEQSVENE